MIGREPPVWFHSVAIVALIVAAFASPPAPAQNGFATIVGRASFERNKWYVSTADRLYVLKVNRKQSIAMLTGLEDSKFKLPLITLDGYTYRTESENLLEVTGVGPVVDRLPQRN